MLVQLNDKGIRKSNSISKENSIKIGDETNTKRCRTVDSNDRKWDENDGDGKERKETKNNDKGIFEKIPDKINDQTSKKSIRLWRYETFKEYETKCWEDVIWWRGRLIKPTRQQRKWWITTLEKMSKVYWRVQSRGGLRQ